MITIPFNNLAKSVWNVALKHMIIIQFQLKKEEV